MAHFVYISDIFCPWCYGFSHNILKIKQEFGLPFEVYGGALVEPRVSLADRLRKSPNIGQFIEKMYGITGVRISADYEKMAFSEEAENIFMDSRKASHLLYVLKRHKPELGLEIMEFLQKQFYECGHDVFADSTVTAAAEQFGIDAKTVFAELADGKTYDLAYEETEKGFEILGEVVLYPTLYYAENGKNYFVSRGYVSYEECRKAVENTAAAVKNAEMQTLSSVIGKACTLDGKCE